VPQPRIKEGVLNPSPSPCESPAQRIKASRMVMENAGNGKVSYMPLISTLTITLSLISTVSLTLSLTLPAGCLHSLSPSLCGGVA